jgi:hypothetical protein
MTDNNLGNILCDNLLFLCKDEGKYGHVNDQAKII